PQRVRAVASFLEQAAFRHRIRTQPSRAHEIRGPSWLTVLLRLGRPASGELEDARRGEDESDARGHFLVPGGAFLLVVALTEQCLRGRDELIHRYLTVLVGTSALDDHTREHRPGPETGRRPGRGARWRWSSLPARTGSRSAGR